ncbi:MAG TPA: Uma2 family endonuclease [Nostocaceae cyanobacterium]|nr:Uma2 family endonuclease [Nostocaceae cyanobacterium]
MNPLVLNVTPLNLTDEKFYQLCIANRDLNLELSAKGELIIYPGSGGEKGIQEAKLITDVGIWNHQTKLGIVFSPSTLFSLPNGAKRSPDVSWIKLERWEALTSEQRQKFPPLTPDFIIELHSESDSLKPLQQKIQEYIDNGLRLGWLINPQDKNVEIYRQNQPVEIVPLPASLAGEDVLPGFELQYH